MPFRSLPQTKIICLAWGTQSRHSQVFRFLKNDPTWKRQWGSTAWCKWSTLMSFVFSPWLAQRAKPKRIALSRYSPGDNTSTPAPYHRPTNLSFFSFDPSLHLNSCFPSFSFLPFSHLIQPCQKLDWVPGVAKLLSNYLLMLHSPSPFSTHRAMSYHPPTSSYTER